MRYEFRTTNGTLCCATDNPEYLCGACRAALIPDPYARGLAKVLSAGQLDQFADFAETQWRGSPKIAAMVLMQRSCQ